MSGCTICRKPLSWGNQSGLCAAHYEELSTVARVERNSAILEARRAGESVKSLSSRFGLTVYTIRQISVDGCFFRPTRRLADIISGVCAVWQVSREQLASRSRSREIMLPRQAVCLLGMRAGHSSTVVSRALSRDHTTIIHGRDAARDRASRDPGYAAALESVWERRPEPFRLLPPVTVQAPKSPPLKVERDYDAEATLAHRAQMAASSRAFLQALAA